MELFDFIRLIFDRNAKWDKVSPHIKSKHFFMVNRFMSINFPMQANIFNKVGVVPTIATDVWRDVVTRLYTRPPVWLYTKTKKKKKEQSSYSKEAYLYWKKLNKVSDKDVGFLFHEFSDEVNDEIMEIEKLLKDSEKV